MLTFFFFFESIIFAAVGGNDGNFFGECHTSGEQTFYDILCGVYILFSWEDTVLVVVK
jgi:hypothetical protein